MRAYHHNEPDQTERPCRKCSEVKPVTQFHVRRNRRVCVDSWCRTCRLAYIRDWQRRNPEQVRLNNRNYAKRYPLNIAKWRPRAMSAGGGAGRLKLSQDIRGRLADSVSRGDA